MDADGDVELSFMEGPSTTGRQQFVWPPREDILHVSQQDIICQTCAPEPGKGRHKQVYTLPDDILAEVTAKFSRRPKR